MDLSDRPRAHLGVWPTPLQDVDGLWMKREDLSGFGFGGNKVRKLEFLLGAAVARGQRRVVTFGALQSNHVRATAAACARLGLHLDAIAIEAVPRVDAEYTGSGNAFLTELFGATRHVVRDDEEAGTVALELMAEHGDDLAVIMPGGSDRIGVLGHVDTALELYSQLEFDPREVVVAASTCGTMAGLVIGLAIAEVDTVVRGVCVYRSRDETETVLRDLLAQASDELGVPLPDDDRWILDDSQFGDGYGIPTESGLAEIHRLATTAGVTLDPVYTAKAYAAIPRDPELRRRTVFLHTGGGPSLFAYRSALT
ncbi:1-aminocyclopropane-1-carboxylate deaminase [Aeromicrobium flavum]|uniref:1-aminocyclopropane-1-carboxylate deaminase n=1 Tax=Aeromicrobium flavum TaxID=416568 RepID=A0A512HVJ5_9ACTN|nr:pyridoxal-phosphate dependent enzyme [Aeromicrobium flavum]GEO89468.1 1-aminocyclopropane-1-carboxylate deaminase [Aeromicrobium flavum]